MFIFGSQCPQVKPERKMKLKYLCAFIVNVYVRYWFTTPVAVMSPFNDLIFLKSQCHWSEAEIQWDSSSLKKNCLTICGTKWGVRVLVIFVPVRIPVPKNVHSKDLPFLWHQVPWNSSITNDEEQKQYLLQIVSQFRKMTIEGTNKDLVQLKPGFVE